MTNLLFKNKKSNAILDTITVLIVIVVFGMISIFGWKIWDDLEADTREAITDPDANESLNVINDRYPETLDGLFIFVLVGFWIIALIASYMIDAHPIFFGISIFLLVFILVAVIHIGNFYEEIMADDDMTGMTDVFPMTNWVLSHMLITFIVIGTSIMLVLYAKLRS